MGKAIVSFRGSPHRSNLVADGDGGAKKDITAQADSRHTATEQLQHSPLLCRPHHPAPAGHDGESSDMDLHPKIRQLSPVHGSSRHIRHSCWQAAASALCEHGTCLESNAAHQSSAVSGCCGMHQQYKSLGALRSIVLGIEE